MLRPGRVIGSGYCSLPCSLCCPAAAVSALRWEAGTCRHSCVFRGLCQISVGNLSPCPALNGRFLPAMVRSHRAISVDLQPAFSASNGAFSPRDFCGFTASSGLRPAGSAASWRPLPLDSLNADTGRGRGLDRGYPSLIAGSMACTTD